MIHLIAIGGAAMHNLALALHHNQHTVTGSDDEIYEPAHSRLSAAGLLPPALGWHPDRIHSRLTAVILGMHARADNPELLEAQKLGIPIYSYPEYIYEHSKNKTRIVVAGSHGKTTTTAMLLHCLHQCGIDTDYLVGAQLAGFDNMVRLSDAPYIVIEGDEYLASALQPVPKFHFYRPHTAIITGIAWDHINVFPSFEEYYAQFFTFLETFEILGELFYYGNDKNCVDMLNTRKKYIPFPTGYYAPNIQIKNGVSSVIDADGNAYAMQIFGKYNFENMEGARLVCQKLGISAAQFYTAMQSFGGTAKRQQLIYNNERVRAYLDFAHAPSKVKATVKALRQQFPMRNLTAVLELHTFSSLNIDFLPQYQHTLAEANTAIIFYDPHTLATKGLPPLSNADIAAHFDHPNLIVLTDPDKLLMQIRTALWIHCTLLLMTSGNFGNLDYQAIFK
jgi:UDP-N-acetylmuramate: L-alanyl-gamma-D-glutamyl-meso-diaminopimelate ligase